MGYYTDPKTNWAVPDIVQTTDMNAIGANLGVSRLGGGEGTMPSVAAAADLTLDLVHNAFEVTGTATINRIEYYDGVSVNRDYGNIITLFFTGISGCTINTTSAANNVAYLGIVAASGITSIAINQYDCCQFILMDIASTPKWIALQTHNTGNG